MKTKLLNWLVCPECRSKLNIVSSREETGEIKEGVLSCNCGKGYAVRDFIPRFVESGKYAESFAFEWSMHARTQLDSANRNNISEEAFRSRIDFSLADLRGRLVLDAGCGMGRYAEIAAKHGAEVIGFDLSGAVDVAFRNIGFKENVYLVQANIFKLPFVENAFDFIYSFGVLHHTSDCEKAFKQLPYLLKPGKKISIFVYSSYNKGIVYSSNFWRFFTTKLPRRLLYYLSYISVPLYFVYKIPVLGNILKTLFVIPMNPDWKWRILDTFDWYSPKYQSKHTHAQVYRWFNEEGLSDIKIFDGEVTMLGVKDERGKYK